jgi:hypothetical protein
MRCAFRSPPSSCSEVQDKFKSTWCPEWFSTPRGFLPFVSLKYCLLHFFSSFFSSPTHICSCRCLPLLVPACPCLSLLVPALLGECFAPQSYRLFPVRLRGYERSRPVAPAGNMRNRGSFPCATRYQQCVTASNMRVIRKYRRRLKRLDKELLRRDLDQARD